MQEPYGRLGTRPPCETVHLRLAPKGVQAYPRAMNIGQPKRVIEVVPSSLPLPEPAPPPAAEPAREPEPAVPQQS